MLNLIVVNFVATELDRVATLAKTFTQLRLFNVCDSGSLLEATERSRTAAVVFWLESEPGEAQLELIQRLTLLKIPSIAVTTDTFPDRARLSCMDRGFMAVLSARTMESRLPGLLEMFAGRAELLSTAVEKKVQQAADVGLLFDSPEIKELLTRLDRVAGLSSTIMLTGETGVGKSTIARWIHGQSARSTAPFVDVPCAALPSNLIESELFGHVRGSFTSADRDHVGKFKVAEKGTLLLDEIDCLPLEVQGKLLRAVERREFERVGSTLTEKFEARLVVATNRPLEIEVSEGRFRSDLYYRLGVLSFRVPALREREGSVRPLAELFVERFAKEHSRPVTGFSSAAMHALEAYSWPGNLRELRNAVEYSVAVCSGKVVQWSDIPDAVRNPLAEPGVNPSGGQPRVVSLIEPAEQVSGPPMGSRLSQVRSQAERELLIAILSKHGNNRSRTALELGISRVTLYKRLERLGISALRAESYATKNGDCLPNSFRTS